MNKETMKSLDEFIEENFNMLVYIIAGKGEINLSLNSIKLWIMNDADLYELAKTEGVEFI